MKIEKCRKMLWEIIKIDFKAMVFLLNILMIIFLFLGAASSIILLYKMFPETSIIILSILSKVFNLFLPIFKITFWILMILVPFAFWAYVYEILSSISKKRKNKKKGTKKVSLYFKKSNGKRGRKVTFLARR